MAISRPLWPQIADRLVWTERSVIEALVPESTRREAWRLLCNGNAARAKEVLPRGSGDALGVSEQRSCEGPIYVHLSECGDEPAPVKQDVSAAEFFGELWGREVALEDLML
jgi:hypothetical protein